jgi:hypothetical protein
MALVSLQALLALRFRFIAYSATSLSLSAFFDATATCAFLCETRDEISWLLPSLTLLPFLPYSSSFSTSSSSSSLALVVCCLSLEQSSCIWHSLHLLMENLDHLLSFSSIIRFSVCTETYGARS